MKRFRTALFAPLALSLVLLTGCTADSLLSDESGSETLAAASKANNSSASSDACWGQATAVFAMMGEMGYHASHQEEPRAGLANLADYLAMKGYIEEGTMQALGAFVAEGSNLTIEACM